MIETIAAFFLFVSSHSLPVSVPTLAEACQGAKDAGTKRVWKEESTVIDRCWNGTIYGGVINVPNHEGGFYWEPDPHICTPDVTSKFVEIECEWYDPPRPPRVEKPDCPWPEQPADPPAHWREKEDPPIFIDCKDSTCRVMTTTTTFNVSDITFGDGEMETEYTFPAIDEMQKEIKELHDIIKKFMEVK